MIPENVTGPISGHAEGPVWWSGWGGLRWVDGYAGDLLTLRGDGIHRLHIDDEYAAFVRPRTNGGFAAFGARTLYLSDFADGPATAAGGFALGAARFNDGCADQDGRLLAGTMAASDAGAAGRLLRIGSDLSTSTILSDVTVSNGLAFSPDGSVAYYVDTATGRVDRFDVVDGELMRRRPFVQIGDGDGSPDGLTVAADGSVWVALWGGSAVHGYDAGGRLLERVPLPVDQVSACTFGADDLGTLFITTSAQDMGHDHGTEAGSVFSIRLGVTGMPVMPFAG